MWGAVAILAGAGIGTYLGYRIGGALRNLVLKERYATGYLHGLGEQSFWNGLGTSSISHGHVTVTRTPLPYDFETE